MYITGFFTQANVTASLPNKNQLTMIFTHIKYEAGREEKKNKKIKYRQKDSQRINQYHQVFSSFYEYKILFTIHQINTKSNVFHS